ncbi:hypothetical protein VNO80_06102 [Phaseolus coccineus]|uniref:Uncharacterized protein n=1 Tax=Phaseolus coccineus TaxID=3886 RepID=A0AAN9NHH2_PHACN
MMFPASPLLINIKGKIYGLRSRAKAAISVCNNGGTTVKKRDGDIGAVVQANEDADNGSKATKKGAEDAGWREHANDDTGTIDKVDNDNHVSDYASPAETDDDEKQVNDDDGPAENDEDDDNPATNDEDKTVLKETEDGGIGSKGSDGGGIVGEGRQKEKEDSEKPHCEIKSESKGGGESSSRGTG